MLYFRRRAGEVTMAKPLWEEVSPPRKSLKGMSSAQKLGLRYEEKTVEYLYASFPTFVAHLPFKFYGTEDAGRAIPDGVIHFKAEKTITVVEIKYRHSLTAWFQLNDFYLPIVQKAFPGYYVNLLEVCKNYDPGVKLPGKFHLTDRVIKLNNIEARYNILIHTGR